MLTNAAIRVLLADDDEDYAASLGRLIDEQPELTVVGLANDGVETVRLADELEPDAVVVDMHMPRLHGVDAVELIRRKYPHVCLIAVTGDPDETMNRAATQAGADGVIVKGEIIAALIDRIRGGRT